MSVGVSWTSSVSETGQPRRSLQQAGGSRRFGWVGWVGGTHCYLLERLLPGVRADVVVECCGTGERAAAVATFEGSVARVRHHVVPQI